MIPTCPKCEGQRITLEVEALTRSRDDAVLSLSGGNRITIRTEAGRSFQATDLDPESLARCSGCRLEDQLLRFLLDCGKRIEYREQFGHDQKAPAATLKARSSARKGPGTDFGAGMRGKL